MKNIYYNIKDFFFPQQRWIKKYVNWNKWQDKDVLMEGFLSGVIIELVEEEQPLEHFDFEEEEHALFAENLKMAYKWFKEEKPELLKMQEEELDKVPTDDMQIRENGSITFKYSYEETYGLYDDIEKRIINLDTKWFIWTIENRHHLWT